MAYLDTDLSIAEGQTISQPYIVALMTEALELSDGNRVLEIGTGGGYQAEILSHMSPLVRVVTMERSPALAQKARGLIQELGYHNVAVKLAGASLGCPSEGPYDAIIITASAPRPRIPTLPTGGGWTVGGARGDPV